MITYSSVMESKYACQDVETSHADYSQRLSVLYQVYFQEWFHDVLSFIGSL